jgi:hypothetical protein
VQHGVGTPGPGCDLEQSTAYEQGENKGEEREKRGTKQKGEKKRKK